MLDQALERRAASRVGKVLREKYRIDRVIGAGGMAIVYAAVHRNGSRVAIKMLHEELSIRRDMRARFLREGYVANMVGHPGAVRVLDDDIAEDGSAFLVMELLTGETLRARCQRLGGRLPLEEVLALGHQLLSVLGAAHAAGIVHRDIKPDNLFLTTERVLKVLDFGIARIEDDPSALATATGTRLGTPAFMPPELALGRTAEIDGRTDLWSAGATMFQLIAGQIVHDAGGAAEIVVRAATVPARSLASAAPDAPSVVVALVDRALRFARDDRWPTARAMQEAIEEAHLALFEAPIQPFEIAGAPPSGPVSPTEALQGATTSAAVEVESTRGRCERAKNDDAGPPTFSPASDRAALDFRDDAARAPIPRSKDAPTISDVSARPVGTAATGALRGISSARGPRWAHARSIAGGAVLIALAGAATLFFTRRAPPPDRSDALDGKDANSAAAQSARGPRDGCATNRECVEKNGGKPSICRKIDGVCVALETDQCKVLASPGDVENDATVWIGAMFPTSTPPPNQGDALMSKNVLTLAQRDFNTMTGGLLPVRPGAPKRPIAVVVCDDWEAPDRGATHLVKEVRVPAIIGFGRSKEVMELSASLFNPNGVLALAANTATMLTEIPRSPSGERLVWRITSSSASTKRAMAAVVSGVIEPEIRAQRGLLAPDEPIRAVLVRIGNTTGQSSADALASVLRINGKSVAENGDNFRQIEVRDAEMSAADSGVHNEAEVAAKIVELAPHLILYAGSDECIPFVEQAWPRGARFRPRHITSTSFVWDTIAPILRKDPSLRKRYYAVDTATPPEQMSKFLLRYNEVFSPKVTVAPPAPYDAFYLFAYAAAALGAEPITGPALARALPRLMPPGTPIDVGPGGIYQAFYALAEGKNIDLGGIQTTLDFDLRTGDAAVDYSDFCLSMSADGMPMTRESGLFFRAARGELEGTRSCP